MIALYRIIQPMLVMIFGLMCRTVFILPGISSLTKKLRETWSIRSIDGQSAFKSVDTKVFMGQKPIWIHAASGEFEYAKPVIRELKERYAVPVFVTYFSPTYAKNIADFSGVAASCPLPFDTASEIQELIERIQPQALLIARTDVWPNTAAVAKRMGVPTLLFSATFHAESSRLGPLARDLTLSTLRDLTHIQCVSRDDAELLSRSGVSGAEVAGDSRYDQVLKRIESLKALPAALEPMLHPTSFVAGSVWPEDLEPVLLASQKLSKEETHTLVLVPHEIEERGLRSIEEAAQRILSPVFGQNLRIARLSRPAMDRVDVLIVDRVGILAELYTRGQFAFVGGSFRKTVHSVMEPLAAGCATFVGPLHKNNREAIEFQTLSVELANGAGRFPMVQAIADGQEFAVRLCETARHLSRDSGPNHQQECKTQIREAVRIRGGATEKVLAWLHANPLTSFSREQPNRLPK